MRVTRAPWFAALILASGLMGVGFIIKSALLDMKSLERSVVVKGLAEREVPADTVIWPISFSVTGNTLATLLAEIESQNQAVVAFLKLHGFSDDEITLGQADVTDKLAQQYSSPQQQFRYLVNAKITVYTRQLAKVSNALAAMSQLGKQGIAIANSRYDSKIEYLFTDLNSIKPAMVEQATKNAREVADKFAQDSGSTLGKIKSAKQGQFSIVDRDSGTPQVKKVRVVATISYYLSD